VSIEGVAAQAQAAVQRARALFGSPQPPAAAPPLLELAARTITAAGDRAAVLSGELAGQHHGFVREAARQLTGNGLSDIDLHDTVSAAAAVTQGGAQRLDTVVAQTRALARAAATARTPAAQRAVLAGLRAQVAAADSVVSVTAQQAAAQAREIRALHYRSTGRAQDAGFGERGSPQDSPAPGAPPPHWTDRRFWIDVTRIIAVQPGQMPPYGTKQIGPGLWYPVDDEGSLAGPPAAKWPLDRTTFIRVAPGQPVPYGTTELAPGVFAPDPRKVDGGDVPWGSPRAPIDVRDVIQVPPGQIAPWDYVEYLPGWWAPRAPGAH
jgi:hypothetical protein